MVARSAVASLVMVAAALGWVACVGDDPESTTTPGNDGGGTDTGTAVDGNAPGTDAANDVDAGPERECDPTKPFGPKSPVSGILQGGAVARLSQDELTLYYDDFSGSFADAGQSDIVVAKRGKRSDSFGTPVSVGPINTAGREEHPTVTADGTTLFFVRVTGDTHIFFSTRTAGGLFESASEVPDIKAGDFDANPYVGPAGDWIYFQSNRDGGGHVWRSARAPDAGAFGTPEKIAEIVSPGAGEGEGSPVLTPDELTLYFASNRKDLGGTGSADIYIATRTSTSLKFGNIARIEELATAGEDVPTWISPDNCRLYTSYRPDQNSGTSLYVATRPK